MTANLPQDLPDPFDSAALENWLRNEPRVVVAFAARCALMALPGLGALTPYDLSARWARSLVLASFRAIWASLLAAKHPGEVPRAAAEAAAAAARSAAVAADAFAVSEVADAAAAARLAAAAAAETTAAAPFADYAIRKELRGQMIRLMTDIADDHDGDVGNVLAQPAWIGGMLPDRVARQWASMKQTLSIQQHWTVWLDWAEARFRGGPDWPKAVYDELTKWREEWDRDPALVNADIAALVAKHCKATEEPAEQRWDFFLSHASKNNTTATWVHDVIRAAGKTVFFHPRDDKQAANIVSRINDGLSGSDRMLALLSPAYFKSRYCKDEWNAFYQRETEKHADLILQLKLSGDIPWPLAKGKRWHSLLGKSRADQQAIILRAIGYGGPAPEPPPNAPGLDDQRKLRKRLGGAGYAVAPGDGEKLKRRPNALAAANDVDQDVTPDDILRQIRKWAAKMLADAKDPARDGTNYEFPRPLLRRIESINEELSTTQDRIDILALHSNLREFLPMALMDMEDGNIAKRGVWQNQLQRCLEYIEMLSQIFPRISAYNKRATRNFQDTFSREVLAAIAKFRSKLASSAKVSDAMETALRDELLGSFDRAVSADGRASGDKRQEATEAASSVKSEALIKLLAVWEWISDPEQTAQLEKFPEDRRASLKNKMLAAYADLRDEVLEILEFFLMRVR